MKTKLLILFAILILVAIVLVGSGDHFGGHSIQTGLIHESTAQGGNNSLTSPLLDQPFGESSDDGEGEIIILANGNWK